MTINEAFEKWIKDNHIILPIHSINPILWAWQDSAQHYEREIEKYKEIAEAQLRIIQSMKGVCEDMGTTDMFTALCRKDTDIAELQATNHDLREALENIVNTFYEETDVAWMRQCYDLMESGKQTLSATPAE